MFFPIKDENPTIRTPVVTFALIAICILVFFLQITSSEEQMTRIVYQYGLTPRALMGYEESQLGLNNAPPMLTLLTSMFLHGGWMHLIGNMVFLWIFGNNIEDDLGHGRFLVFYIFSGLGAAALQIAMEPDSKIPMIGASGAISGVLGAYLLLYPRARILTLVFLGFFITTTRIAAGWFLGIWFLIQGLFAMTSDSTQGGVAFWAHVGGFVAGLVLLFVVRPRQQLSNYPKRSSPPTRPPHRGPWE